LAVDHSRVEAALRDLRGVRMERNVTGNVSFLPLAAVVD
jgi:hypothetical protein